MEIKSRRRITAVSIVFILVTLGIFNSAACSEKTKGNQSKSKEIIKKAEEWRYYYERRDDVNFLERELGKKPGNEAILSHLMAYYSRHEENQEKLRQYTLEMIKFHPENSIIYFDTVTAFYIYPEFRDEVIKALEAQIPIHQDKADLFWNLAEIYQRKAIPPFSKDTTDKQKKRWFEYLEVPPNTKVPDKIDQDLVKKSEKYYSKAIELVKGDKFYYSFYSGHLAELLTEVGREDEAISLYENAIKSTPQENQCGLYNELGDIYKHRGDFVRARKNYLKAIETDKVSYEHTACRTAYAYTMLGLIALEEGDIKEADEMLLKSADVNRCCHNITKGMPLKLVEALIERGEYEASKKYLKIILKKFTPGGKEEMELLHKAEGLKSKTTQE